MSAAVQKIEPQQQNEIAPANSATAIVSMIERAARDPAVDIDKMERLMQMHERVLAREAKAAYDAALAQMQPELPVIGRRGKIEVRKKDSQGERTGDIQQSTSYALWEDINEGIRPVLAKHGFALSFRVGLAQDGKITVTGILSHEQGHREETTITLMHDSTGSKNAVQAVGSSTSYGKRYTASALLNLTSRGEDDDGKAGGAKPITAEEAESIADIISTISGLPRDAEKNPVRDRLLRWVSTASRSTVTRIEDIPSEFYDGARKNLENLAKAKS